MFRRTGSAVPTNPESRIPVRIPDPQAPIPELEVRMPVVMDGERMSRSLTRIAHEIVERNRGVGDLALVGVRTRGVPIARAARRDPARDHRRTRCRPAPSTSRSTATT